MKPNLNLKTLQEEAPRFAEQESTHSEPVLWGVTDGKAIGTYFEHKFQEYLAERYEWARGSSASGLDFPDLGVDIKVTSVNQPQSSCPFESVEQKIYGLGYSLLVFVYEKTDDATTRTGRLNVRHTIFIDKLRTGDYQTTTGILRILQNNGNRDDLVAFMQDRMLPVDEIGASNLADKILEQPPEIGYLTISNAPQWRLKYARVIEKAGTVEGIMRLR